MAVDIIINSLFLCKMITTMIVTKSNGIEAAFFSSVPPMTFDPQRE
jgi:hypothetical protein